MNGQVDGIWKVPARHARAFEEAQVAAQKACREEKRADRLLRREQVDGEDDLMDLFGCIGLD
jgi:hypothetical protein